MTHSSSCAYPAGYQYGVYSLRLRTCYVLTPVGFCLLIPPYRLSSADCHSIFFRLPAGVLRVWKSPFALIGKNHHHRTRGPQPKMPPTKTQTQWKDIPPVPSSQEFLDITLSRTQRRLPTQIRAGFKISRIRGFYTRKVKFTQETCSSYSRAPLSVQILTVCSLREDWLHPRGIPSHQRNPSLSQGPPPYPLRCRPLPHRARSTLDSKAPH